MCETESERCIDMKTPRNVLLSAFYKRSNAFDSVNRKLLVILTSITDELVENTLAITQEYGQEAKEELNSVIEAICGLKYEIQTNKPLKKLTSKAPDAYFWNELIEKETALHGETTYFRAIWLLVECYMYRRIAQSFEETNLLKDYDPYRKRKEQLYHAGLSVMTEVGSNLLGFVQNCVAEKEEFISLLKLDLWGNRLDLALSLTHSGHSELLEIHALDSQILCDHSERIWEAVSDTKSSSNIIGELHYRKLFDDKNWDPETSVDDALQRFQPSKLCTLRIIKSDVCELDEGVGESIQDDSLWMERGDWDLFSFQIGSFLFAVNLYFTLRLYAYIFWFVLCKYT